jgi:Protein kinase domain/Tetratricopeptide repeat
MGVEGTGAAGFLTGFAAGSRIAGYRLEEQIGRGGMAVVFRAQDERLNRQVALKVLAPALAADEDFRHRFIRESRSAAAVDDPHIIPVFEAGEADDVLFIAMRYVPGGDVRALLRRLGPLPTARAAGIISAVASALDAAHAARLVHRDVKPANMLVDVRPGRPDHVYLSDFGLTKGAVSSASMTRAGAIMGTLNYCAPEQIRGQQVDARTDEYALACAVFTLMSGTPPFHRHDDAAVLYAQLSDPPPPLTLRRPDLPPAVDNVLQQALAKAPSDRYASCGEFADALRLALGLQRYDSDLAVALHQRSLTDHQHRLGLDHADKLATNASVAAARQEATLATRFATAQQMTVRGDHSGAEQEFRHVLAEQTRALGQDHPDTLIVRFAIAQEMAARGDHAAAEKAFQDVLPHMYRKLGADHPDTLATRFAIAQEMAVRGDHAGAEDGFRAVFAARQQTLGPDHPDTLIAWFAIAQETAARGDHTGAENGFRAMLPQLQRTLGADHPDTLATRFAIAREMAARGDHTGSEKEFRDVLPNLERKLGRDHPVTLILWFSIAREMTARGNYAGAEREFRDMLPHLRRKLGPDHPDALAAAEWLDRIQGKTVSFPSGVPAAES